MAETRAILRIKNEIKNYNTKLNQEFCEENDIFIVWNEEDITKAQAIIAGSTETIYEGMILLFNISYPPEYPQVPPNFTFVSPKYTDIKRIHPNLYETGKVCLSVINTWGEKEWTTCYTTQTILLTIKSILNNNPINNEPSYYKTLITDKQAINYINAVKYVVWKSSHQFAELYEKSEKYDDKHLYYKEIHEDIRDRAYGLYIQHMNRLETLKEELQDFKGKTIRYIHGNVLVDLDENKLRTNEIDNLKDLEIR